MSINFAAQIKEARKKHGMTQQQLASRLNITQQTVHNWEKGAIPGGDRLVEISRVLGINFAVEQAEKQEPVAWMVYTLDGTAAWVTLNPADFTSEHRALPLYTAPPQRQPLTGEEMQVAVAAEREAIAQMVENAPPLAAFANDNGGCVTCGFTPKLAARAIRARGQA
jgi:transcriptional regulator with XRE-family HTH domain